MIWRNAGPNLDFSGGPALKLLLACPQQVLPPWLLWPNAKFCDEETNDFFNCHPSRWKVNNCQRNCPPRSQRVVTLEMQMMATMRCIANLASHVLPTEAIFIVQA